MDSGQPESATRSLMTEDGGKVERYGPFSSYNSFDVAIDSLAGVLDTLGTSEAKYATMAEYSLDPETCLDAAKLCDYVAHEIMAAVSGFHDISESVHVRNLEKQSELYKKLTEPARRKGAE